MPKTALPPSTDFSPEALLWLQGPHGEPSVRRQDRQVGMQPEWHTWNPRHDGPSRWRRCSRDPMGSLAGKPKSYAHGGLLLQLFQASADAFKNTPKERCNVTTHHAISTGAAQLRIAPSSGRGASPSRTLRRAPRVARRGTNRASRRPQLMTMMASMSEQAG
jgi:hypothetical protein